MGGGGGEKWGLYGWTTPNFRISVTGFGFRGPFSIFASRSYILIREEGLVHFFFWKFFCKSGYNWLLVCIYSENRRQLYTL